MSDNLLWLDMEMTGLDVIECRIIEIAAIVTGIDLAPLDAIEEVVFQPPEALAAMDEWNTRTHGESGLTERVPHGRPLADVEDDVLALCDRWFDEDPIVLAGNSIGQDRKFIDRYMPRFADRLHYRMIDVSSWKEVFRRRFGIEYDKQGTHRALDDIGESIAELTSYLGYVTVEPDGS